jgi:beta-barrel assembly-enhancing protease
MRIPYSMLIVVLLSSYLITSSACKGKGENPCLYDGRVGNVLFTVEDDKTLGIQVRDQILADPEFKILNQSQYPDAYQYMNVMRDYILASGNVVLKDEFEWKIYIVENDEVQNAFCTPGGYMFFYTGLMKSLNSSSALAGVLGHEMAHADRRHSIRQLTNLLGFDLILQILLGEENAQIASLATAVIGLQYSRSFETEADKSSVHYLCTTPFDGRGAKFFFENLIAQGYDCTGAFFSTHPCPSNRIGDIEDTFDCLDCSPASVDQPIIGMTYANFLSKLP